MCGGGYQYKDGAGAVWKITDDGKHIIFYGKYEKCPTSTGWCRKHCYLKTRPTDKDVNPTYNLNTFKAALVKKDKELFDDLSKAKYVTLFASGCLGGVQNFYGIPLEETIFNVCHDMLDKKIMFFVRQEIDFSERLLVKPDNAVIVVSVDNETSMELINWAIDSDLISAVSIVNHKDNLRVLKMIKTAIPLVVECSTCKDYDCYKSKKRIILCKYQD